MKLQASRLWHKYFAISFSNFPITPFLQDTLQLLLYFGRIAGYGKLSSYSKNALYQRIRVIAYDDTWRMLLRG